MKNEFIYVIQVPSNSGKIGLKIGKTNNKNRRKKEHGSKGDEVKFIIDPIDKDKIKNKEIKESNDIDTTLRKILWNLNPALRDIAYWNKNRDNETIEAAKKDGFSINHDETFWPKDDVPFDLFVKIILDCIKKIINYDSEIFRKEQFKFSNFQAEIFDKAYIALLNGNNVLLDCCPRDGKSSFFIRLSNLLGKKHILIISWWISPDSFKKELTYRGYEKYSFVMYNSKRFNEIMKTGNWNENEIIYISAQTFQKLNDKELQILKRYCDFVGVDEIHNGTDTKKFSKAYEKTGLNEVQQIHMSGTPYNDLLCGRYTNLNWTHIRHSILDRLYDKLIAKYNDYFAKGFPNIHMYLVESMHRIAKRLYKEEFGENDEFSWEKFLDKSSDKSLKKFIKEFFIGDTQNSKYEGWDFNSFKNICEIFQTYNIIISLDKINGVNRLEKILKELINEDDEFKNMTITTLTGIGRNNGKDYGLDQTTYVNDVFRKNKGKINIVLTVDAGMTGKTYDEANCFIFMRNIKSSERIDQYYFRILTPFEDKKDVVVIFADSQQMTSAIGQLIDGIYLSSNQDHNIMREKFKKIIENNCLNIFKEGNLKFIEYNYQELINIHTEYMLSAPSINYKGLYDKIKKFEINVIDNLDNYDEFNSIKIKMSNKIEKQIGEDKKTSGRKSSTTIIEKDDKNKNENDFTINQKVLITICENIKLIRSFMIKNYGLEDDGCVKIFNGEFPSKDWWERIDKVQFTSNEDHFISGKKFFEIIKTYFSIKEIEMLFKRFADIENNNQFIY